MLALPSAALQYVTLQLITLNRHFNSIQHNQISLSRNIVLLQSEASLEVMAPEWLFSQPFTPPFATHTRSPWIYFAFPPPPHFIIFLLLVNLKGDADFSEPFFGLLSTYCKEVLM